MMYDQIPVSARLNRHRERTVCLPKGSAEPYLATADQSAVGYTFGASAVTCREIFDKAMMTFDQVTYDRMQRLLGFETTDQFADHIATACDLHVRVADEEAETHLLNLAARFGFVAESDGVEVAISDWEPSARNEGEISRSLWALRDGLVAEGFECRAV